MTTFDASFKAISTASSSAYNYKDAYILLEIQVVVPYERQDQGKKSIPQLLYLKNRMK